MNDEDEGGERSPTAMTSISVVGARRQIAKDQLKTGLSQNPYCAASL